MRQKQLLEENELASLAKTARMQARISKAEVARQLGVTKSAIHQAEEYPFLSLTKLRIKIIEKCSTAKTSGPLFQIETESDSI